MATASTVKASLLLSIMPASYVREQLQQLRAENSDTDIIEALLDELVRAQTALDEVCDLAGDVYHKNPEHGGTAKYVAMPAFVARQRT